MILSQASGKGGRQAACTGAGAVIIVVGQAGGIGAVCGAAAVALDVAVHLLQRSPRGDRALRKVALFLIPVIAVSGASVDPANAQKRASS